MVTLVYRCETDDRDVTSNHEHDDYEWVAPETATERLASTFGRRFERAVERAVEMDDETPFAAVADPYESSELSSDEILEELAAVRTAEPAAEIERD